MQGRPLLDRRDPDSKTLTPSQRTRVTQGTTREGTTPAPLPPRHKPQRANPATTGAPGAAPQRIPGTHTQPQDTALKRRLQTGSPRTALHSRVRRPSGHLRHQRHEAHDRGSPPTRRTRLGKCVGRPLDHPPTRVWSHAPCFPPQAAAPQGAPSPSRPTPGLTERPSCDYQAPGSSNEPLPVIWQLQRAVCPQVDMTFDYQTPGSSNEPLPIIGSSNEPLPTGCINRTYRPPGSSPEPLPTIWQLQ